MENEVTIQEQESYSQFKQRFDEELKKTAEGFVRIGYLLKVARDTNILQESGYKSEAEFAKAEYGLSKDQVSRFIRINDRFSVNGYSDQLAEPYAAYGVSKLAEMLTLPEKLIEAMSPDMSKTQIQDMRKEVREEEKITDIEVMLEPKEEAAGSLLEQVMRKYFADPQNRETLLQLKEAGNETRKAVEVLAPAGTNCIMERISGRGKFAWILKGENEPVELVDVRQNEKEEYTWNDVMEIAQRLEVPEKKEEVAPVQQQMEKLEETEQDRQEIGEEKTPETAKLQDAREVLNESIDDTKEKEEKEEKKEEEKQAETAKLQDASTIQEDENEKLNIGMMTCARNAFKNLQISMENESYKAALADARHLVHYLEAAGVENDEKNNE